MKYRKLITGKRVRETEKPLKWGFESKCPAKWVHVDCESGHAFIAAPLVESPVQIFTHLWVEPTIVQLEAAIKSLQQYKAMVKARDKILVIRRVSDKSF